LHAGNSEEKNPFKIRLKNSGVGTILTPLYHEKFHRKLIGIPQKEYFIMNIKNHQNWLENNCSTYKD
jgi:hypothetical protein